MTKLKRPERCVNFESIKPELREITEFYTRKVKDYLHCLKQLNEYADELENEISVLKETPKVEVLLDDMSKPLVEVPEFVAEYIERCKSYGCGLIWAIRPDRDANDNSEEVYDWLFPNGYRLEDGSFPDPFEPDNLVRPDSDNQLKFVRAWLDGYTVEKEKKYILKHIDLSEQYKNESLYLSHSRHAKLKHESFSKDADMSEFKQCHFIQSEIDKLNIGSYVKIRVEP